MDRIQSLAILVPLLPLAGAALVGLVGLRWLRDRSHWLVLGGVVLALVSAMLLFSAVRAQIDQPEGVGLGSLADSLTVYEWISAGGGSWLNVTFRVAPLTCIMLLTVLGVSAIIIAYSVGYMRDHHGRAERGYERFFAFLGLFVFSMCTLVLAGNFLLLYLGWELVGLCSYLLIGFHYHRPAAAAAAKKAFLVNRVGDFGFGLGILLIYLTFGSLDYATVFDMVERGVTATGDALSSGRITAVALLLFCGAMGKSAQLPLHVWLPDAMEGPTPVSALIHAATMVTAGVYMVARCCVIFAAAPIALAFVACVGAATAFFAATVALTQFDMKRILAYSTLSQLGYMFLGLGVGAFDAAIFHLYTHAFFKALLFLGAGSVMHAMGGVIDVRQFGGLAKAMKVTAVPFWVGGLALAGFPLLAGFWSKDEIVHAALSGGMPWLGVLALVTALLTAFYTFRMVFTAFHGKQRLPRGVEHAHESGRWMTVPLALLAVGAALAGYVGVSWHTGGFLGVFEPGGGFQRFLAPVFERAHAASTAAGAHAAGGLSGHAVEAAGEAAGAASHGGHGLMYFSAVLSILGMAVAWLFYRRQPMLPKILAVAMPNVYRVLLNKYYVDELYDWALVRPLRRLGDLCYGIDQYVINSILWLITAVPRAVGFGLKGWQQGALQGYALGMAAGIMVLVWWVLWATP